MFKTAASKIAHNTTIPSLGGNKDLRTLQDLITAEKAVIISLQRLSIDFGKAAEALKAWGVGEGEDLGDILSASKVILSLFAGALEQYASHGHGIRDQLKAVRTREEAIDELRRRHRNVASKVDSAEKKLSKMSSEHKNLAAQSELLNKLRDEMRSLATEILIEEARLGDFKRTATRAWLSLKFGGLLECSEKGALVGEYGRVILAEVPDTLTEPGLPRALYVGAQRVNECLNEANQRVNEVTFSAAPNKPQYRPPQVGLNLEGGPNDKPLPSSNLQTDETRFLGHGDKLDSHPEPPRSLNTNNQDFSPYDITHQGGHQLNYSTTSYNPGTDGHSSTYPQQAPAPFAAAQQTSQQFSPYADQAHPPPPPPTRSVDDFGVSSSTQDKGASSGRFATFPLKGTRQHEDSLSQPQPPLQGAPLPQIQGPPQSFSQGSPQLQSQSQFPLHPQPQRFSSLPRLAGPNEEPSFSSSFVDALTNAGFNSSPNSATNERPGANALTYEHADDRRPAVSKIAALPPGAAPPQNPSVSLDYEAPAPEDGETGLAYMGRSSDSPEPSFIHRSTRQFRDRKDSGTGSDTGKSDKQVRFGAVSDVEEELQRRSVEQMRHQLEDEEKQTAQTYQELDVLEPRSPLSDTTPRAESNFPPPETPSLTHHSLRPPSDSEAPPPDLPQDERSRNVAAAHRISRELEVQEFTPPKRLSQNLDEPPPAGELQGQSSEYFPQSAAQPLPVQDNQTNRELSAQLPSSPRGRALPQEPRRPSVDTEGLSGVDRGFGSPSTSPLRGRASSHTQIPGIQQQPPSAREPSSPLIPNLPRPVLPGQIVVPPLRTTSYNSMGGQSSYGTPSEFPRTLGTALPSPGGSPPPSAGGGKTISAAAFKQRVQQIRLASTGEVPGGEQTTGLAVRKKAPLPSSPYPQQRPSTESANVQVDNTNRGGSAYANAPSIQPPHREEQKGSPDEDEDDQFDYISAYVNNATSQDEDQRMSVVQPHGAASPGYGQGKFATDLEGDSGLR